MNGWEISNSEYTKESFITNGNRFFCGNGHMGYRGVVEEAEKEAMPALIVNGIYDQNGDKWREPVNFPNPLSVETFHEQQKLCLDGESETLSVVKHMQKLDYRYGIYSRFTTWKSLDAEITVAARRFVSMAQKSLMCLEYSVTSNTDTCVNINCFIDGDVYDCNGPHLENEYLYAKNNTSIFTGRVRMSGLEFAECQQTSGINQSSAVVALKENKPFVFHVFAALETGEDCQNRAIKNAINACDAGFDEELKRHCREWDKLWQDGDVVIDGDEEAQTALRYSLYHLLSIAPDAASGLSVPARGLSGQTYKGAVFWDTEMFISPYFLYTRPEIVKGFIRYRINTLKGAMDKARFYGYRGAFYAWESQEDGSDACSDYNVTDVFTGRPQRTYFRDKQIHISAAVVYMINEYLKATEDFSILEEGALEVVLECAVFYASRCLYNPVLKQYEYDDVIGPDEYHERVNNNAYTNKMALFTMKTALKLCGFAKENKNAALLKVIEKTGFNEYKNLIEQICEGLKALSIKDNVIEQFDQYFQKEDCSLETVRSRLLNPKEYWGGANGVASGTQIIKQADVAVMLNLFAADFTLEQKSANYAYYEKRTEHGSSLSACMYALLACQTGQSSAAYDFFLKTAQVDLSGQSKQFAGLVYIGGTHPAASGGAWMTAIKGFCGFDVENGQPVVKPQLPENWKSVEFTAVIKNKKYSIKVSKDGNKICEK